MKTFIVIPAYNEEKRIGQVIQDLLGSGYENIVVVNDASSDKTDVIVKNCAVDCIDHIVNLGQGASLRTGTQYAVDQGADVVVHFDSDGQHQVKDIEKFTEKISDGYDVVIGSRYLGSQENIPFSKKYFIHKPGVWVNWILTGLKLTDAHNGFRAMNRNSAQKIRITQDRMAHASEIPAEIKFHDLKHAEVPVDIIYHEYGQNLRGGITVVVDFVKQKLIS